MESTLKSGVCPKCNSDEVYYTSDDGHMVLPHGLKVDWVLLASRPEIVNFACANCGYVEFYVTADHLERVKKDWLRVKVQR